MASFVNRFKSRTSPSGRDELSMPLHGMRTSEETPLNDQSGGSLGDEEDEDDVDPLLPSAERTLERVKAEIEHELGTSMGDTTYDRKSKIMNKAIQDIGMGRYQWQLFSLCGMGWLADNLWMQGLALVLPQLTPEFGVSVSHIRYTTMITYIGLSFGSTFWGVASDIIGRKPAFNITLLLCGVFGTLVALGPTWAITCLLFACMGLGVGGNLPVDGALFLEFLPFESNKLLTLLSVWWPVGQLMASILAWMLIPPWSCSPELQPCSSTGAQPCCESSENRGWRYYIASLGLFTLFMFVCRFFLFHLYESPKFLLSRNRQSDAVSVIQTIARYNGTSTWLTDDILDEFGDDTDDGTPKLTVLEINKRNMSKFSFEKVGALFADRKLALTTVLLWFMWAAIGMGYPLFNAFLPQYLEHAGEDSAPVSADVAYRNFFITSIAAVPGSIIAAYTVDIKSLGRKGTMAISTLISGVFLYLFILSDNPSYQLICSSVESFFQNVMYGVLYAYTPEVFPAPCRGTGTGIASLLNRIAGITAPVLAAQIGDVHPSAPIIAAGACYMAASVAMLLLPIETRGTQSL